MLPVRWLLVTSCHSMSRDLAARMGSGFVTVSLSPRNAMRMSLRLKRLITTPLVLLAALILWFSEWLWDPLERWMARIGQWPGFRWLEKRIAQSRPYPALACFLLPGLALLPFKILGLFFMAHGAPLLGLLTFLGAKIVGTALVARIFSLTRPQLLSLNWFAKLYYRLIDFKARVFNYLHQHPAYQHIHARLQRARQQLTQTRRSWSVILRRRWRAIYRHQKHQHSR